MKKYGFILLVSIPLFLSSCSGIVETVSDWVHGLFPERVINDEEAERKAKDEEVSAKLDELAEIDARLRKNLKRQGEKVEAQQENDEDVTTEDKKQTDGTFHHDESHRGKRDVNGHIIDYEYSFPYMNGTMYITCYQDGYTLARSVTPCYLCNGTGTCNVCKGTGSYFHRALLKYYPCPACVGSTACKYCQGKGQTGMAKLYAPGEAEAYMQAKREEKESTHSSSSSSSSNAGTCSKCGGTGIDPFPSSGGNLTKWVAYYHRGDGRCPYCSRYDEHYHTKCPRCNVPH